MPAWLDRLKHHNAIAWDFDQTLVDNPASEQFHAFIRDTPTKRHCIVTFRSGVLFSAIGRDLARYPDPPQFDAIFGIEHERWAAWDHDQWRRQSGRLEGPPTPAEQFYVNWKGGICHREGLTALVDDDLVSAPPGCLLFGIDFFPALPARP